MAEALVVSPQSAGFPPLDCRRASREAAYPQVLPKPAFPTACWTIALQIPWGDSPTSCIGRQFEYGPDTRSVVCK